MKERERSDHNKRDEGQIKNIVIMQCPLLGGDASARLTNVS